MSLVTAADEARLRRGLAIAGLLYATFVVYGSLVPLQYQALPWEEAWRRLLAMPFSALGPGSRVDWGVNVMLFTPLGFLLLGALTAGRRHRWLGLILLAPLWPALAGTIEFAQLFFPPRTTGLHDIVAETIGGLAGGLLWLAVGDGFSLHAMNWARARHRSTRLGALLYLYALLFAIYQLMPLDLTISLADLHEKWADGRVNLVPFGHRYRSATEAVIDVAGDIGSWIPLGFLAAAAGRASWRSIVAGCALFGLLLEGAQLLVFSRLTDVTDILFAAAGAAAGVGLARWAGLAGAEDREARTPHPAELWWALALLYGLVLPILFSHPWNFDLSPQFVKPRLEAFWAMPFRSQAASSAELHAVAAMANKVMLFAPLGILLFFAVDSTRPALRRAAALAGAGFVGVIGLACELAKVFEPSHFAEISGAILMWVGAAAGAVGVGGWPRLRRRRKVLSGAARRWLLGVTALAAAIAVVTQLPGVPYNVPELLRQDAAALSVVMLALGFGVLAASPRLARVSAHGYDATRAAACWPLQVVGISILGALLIYLAVPEEATGDVVGSPVLGIWGPLETLVRLATLLAGLLWLALGGGIAFWPRLAKGPNRTALLSVWLLWSIVILPLVHWVVVEAAATDNLTELMADGGGLRASLALGAYVAVLGAGGAAVARAWGAASHSDRLLGAVVVLVSVAVGWSLLQLGTEPVLVKYGRVYSALQFLLSMDRDHLAAGSDLFLRFAAVHLMAVAACGWAHGLASMDLPEAGKSLTCMGGATCGRQHAAQRIARAPAAAQEVPVRAPTS